MEGGAKDKGVARKEAADRHFRRSEGRSGVVGRAFCFTGPVDRWRQEQIGSDLWIIKEGSGKHISDRKLDLYGRVRWFVGYGHKQEYSVIDNTLHAAYTFG